MAVRRSLRTVLLALVAAAVFAWSAIHHFDVAPAEMLNILWMSLALVAIAMLLAVLVLALRALFQRRR
jgi:hypothetical protein